LLLKLCFERLLLRFLFLPHVFAFPVGVLGVLQLLVEFGVFGLHAAQIFYAREKIGNIPAEKHDSKLGYALPFICFGNPVEHEPEPFGFEYLETINLVVKLFYLRFKLGYSTFETIDT